MNGKQQIVLVAFVKTIYRSLASCSIISKYEPHEYKMMYASLFVYLSFFFFFFFFFLFLFYFIILFFILLLKKL